MIGFKDTITLARTKLRTKRVRLVVTVVVSGLVFGLVVGALAIFSGVAGSLERYADRQFDGKFFVAATRMYEVDSEFANDSQQNIERSKQLHKEYVQERREAANRLGVPYDPSAETPPTESYGGDNYELVNLSSVAGQRAQEEFFGKLLKKNNESYETLIKKQAAPYSPSNVFQLKSLAIGNSQLMENGKESFDSGKTGSQESFHNGWMDSSSTSVSELGYRLASNALLDSYILPVNERRNSSSNRDAIPVVVPINAAVKTFEKSKKLPPRPTNAKELTSWVATVRSELNGQTYSVCYRNDASQELVRQALSQQKEIVANKGKSDYQAPVITYILPADDSCGAVTVNDSRSATEKATEEKMLALEKSFGNTPQTPQQQKLNFAIVGLSPSAPDYNNGSSLEGFVSSFIGMNIIESIMVPRDAYEQLPLKAQHQDILIQEPKSNQEKYASILQQEILVSFNSIDSARAYIETESCNMNDMRDFNSGCPAERPFLLTAFGTNYMAIDEAARYGEPVLLVILAIVGTVAGIIIMAMMGRVMADSRRETAVFRAIGARSSDIVKVYLLYALAVAGRIVLFAVALGATIALLLELLYASRASYYAQAAYGVFDDSLGFHFIGFSWYILALIAGIIILGLVGVSLPLLRNIRRNPISDMRDE